MSLSNENNPQSMHLNIGAVSAGSAETRPGYSPLGKDKVLRALLINGAVLAGDDVDNVLVQLRKVGTVDIVASYLNDVASGGLAANVAKAMTLDSSLVTLADAEDLEVVISHNGAGQALTNAKIQLEVAV